MKRENLSRNYKKILRKECQDLRKGLSLKRRQESSLAATKKLEVLARSYARVLSFASTEEEIDLWTLNVILAKEKKLLLPRQISLEGIAPFQVCDIEKDLQPHPRWKIQEPVGELPVSIEKVGCVLVPAIAFDNKNHRLGYGKGFYDRFLAQLKCPFFGVGFKEQLTEELIPVEPHDVPMTEVLLF